MINANDYGFLPGNDCYKNSVALQKAVDYGGEIVVSLPGVYPLSEQIEIGDNTTLVFKEGVIVAYINVQKFYKEQQNEKQMVEG